MHLSRFDWTFQSYKLITACAWIRFGFLPQWKWVGVMVAGHGDDSAGHDRRVILRSLFWFTYKCWFSFNYKSTFCIHNIMVFNHETLHWHLCLSIARIGPLVMVQTIQSKQSKLGYYVAIFLPRLLRERSSACLADLAWHFSTAGEINLTFTLYEL